MMDIEKLKGVYAIERFGEYLILHGPDFRIYKLDGSLVAKKAWRNVTCIVPLSSSSVLLLCGAQKAYIATSIPDGEELWRIQFSWNKFFLTQSITANHSRTRVYHYIYGVYKSDMDHLVVIDIAARRAELLPLKKGLRAIVDIVCDSDDTPCLLEHHNECIGGKEVSINGIRLLFQDPLDIGEDPGSAYYYKYKWEAAPAAVGRSFFVGTDVILTDNSKWYSPKTGEYRPIIKNGELNMRFHIYNKSMDGRYLQLFEPHGLDGRDVVVDIQEQRVVAQYNVEYPGCIVGDEYWSTTKKGFGRRPFPLIEEYHPRLLAFGDILRMTEN